MIRHEPCTCTRAIPSGRFYLGYEACRICRRLLGGTRMIRRVAPRPKPEPQTITKAEGILLAAAMWRDDPMLTNSDMYRDMQLRLREEDMEMPAYATWITSWAPEARQKSGTPPISGRVS